SRTNKKQPASSCFAGERRDLVLLCGSEKEPMSLQTAAKSSNALEGIHGVHVVSPFSYDRTTQVGDFQTNKSSEMGTNQRLFIERVWQQRPPCLRPIHCCIRGIIKTTMTPSIFVFQFSRISHVLTGDQSVLETAANVATSLPFIFLGMQAPRKNLNTKVYANSLIGVGIASSLYHASRGKLRKYLRWLDYTMIATTTICLSRALRNENPKFLMAASALVLPFQPLMVSAVHTGMMEVAFAKRSLKDPDLKTAHNVHKMSSLLGGALFLADDFFPETQFLHAGWHLAAAIGVGTCNKLLEYPGHSQVKRRLKPDILLLFKLQLNTTEHRKKNTVSFLNQSEIRFPVLYLATEPTATTLPEYSPPTHKLNVDRDHNASPFLSLNQRQRRLDRLGFQRDLNGN
ncbi:hypothetical protein HID58_075594, partial [Brassica napus]